MGRAVVAMALTAVVAAFMAATLLRTTTPLTDGRLEASVVAAALLAASAIAFATRRARSAQPERRPGEDHLQLAFEAAPIGMAVVATDGRFLRVNGALCTTLGLGREALLATTFQELTHPDDLAADLELLRGCLRGKLDGYDIEKRYIRPDGEEVWAHLNVALARDGNGRPSHFVAQVLDITERRSAVAALAASEARFVAMVEHGTDLVAISDAAGRLKYASPSYYTVLGFDPEQCIGLPLQDHIHPDDRDAVFALGLALSATPGDSATLEFRYAHADGSWRWFESTLTNRVNDPAVQGFVTNSRDITERVLATERLAHQATHDSLTGLPNRVLLDDRMQQARASAVRHDEVFAVIYVDVDHFKHVNDSYGHGIGDLVLSEVAQRLRAAARMDDTVARIGGDEFVLIATLADEGASFELATRICEGFERPFTVNGVSLTVTASAGMATTAGIPDGADLLEAADSALYEAKAKGRNCWVSYVPPTGPNAEQGTRVRRPATTPLPADRRRPDAPLTEEQLEVGSRYRTHVAESALPLVVHSDGVIVAASPSAVALLEADDLEALLGRHVFEFVTADSMAASQARQQAIQAGGWPQPEVVELATVTGRHIEVEVASTPAFWNGGLASQLTLRPVRDRAAEVVRVGSELTRSVADAVIITDLDRQIVAWNDEATRAYGWSRDEVIGRDVSVVVPWAGSESERAHVRHELRARGRWEGKAAHVGRDGSVVAGQAVTQVIHDHEGQPIGTVSINTPSTVPEPPASDASRLLDELAVAIVDDQIEIVYQPIVDAQCRLVKVEALVRWRHPTRGLLLPETFVPAVERSPLIAEFTDEVLRQAAAQVVSWRANGNPHLELAVNISGRELTGTQLANRVTRVLESTGLPADALWLEVTETAVVQEGEQADEALEHLAARGVRFALDDFGTGFATLAQLHRFPAHALKIDRLFVDGLTSGSGGDFAIIRSVLALGRELGLVVIAEGVETDAQHDALLRLGCELFQGYLFANPGPADPTPRWLTGAPRKTVRWERAAAV